MQQFSSLLSWRLFKAQHVSGVFPPIIRSSMTAVAASGFTCVSWWQLCCVHGRADQLMMGGKTPETRWAVNKRQDNKLENCCIWLVIYLKCTMMHRLTNLKFWKLGFCKQNTVFARSWHIRFVGLFNILYTHMVI